VILFLRNTWDYHDELLKSDSSQPCWVDAVRSRFLSTAAGGTRQNHRAADFTVRKS